MKVNVTDYKSFEQLSEDIKLFNKKWKDLSANADKVLTFTWIQKQMQFLYFFITNERNRLYKEIDELKDVWSGKVIAERREQLLTEFNDMVAKSIEAEKQDIATLISSKFEKIGDMLCTAPSEEQLRLLSALQMRGNVDSLEVHHILPVFFENYQSMRVLQAISEQNGIVLYLPAQLDCRTMFNMLKNASDYLLAACNELTKRWDNMDVKFHAFYTTNDKEPDKQYDPLYQSYIDLFDNTPQLQEVMAEKRRLSKVELAKINWCMRDVKELDFSNPEDYVTVAKKVDDVIKEHPEMIELFKLSEYRDIFVNIAGSSVDNIKDVSKEMPEGVKLKATLPVGKTTSVKSE